MDSDIVRIGTRKSQLALWQANDVKYRLQKHFPELRVELLEMSTEGDRNQQTPLASLGGKGLFLKELEQALLDGRADIAVHSMKDVTATLPAGLHIAAICERASPFDALVSNHYQDLQELPAGARIGTCSLRRCSLLLHHRPDLQVLPLRGNVNTRLRKLDDGEFDAIILAAAGLHRLGFAERAKQIIAPEILLPAVGQGAVGIECRQGDLVVEKRLAAINHEATAICVRSERATNARLEGGCHSPIAVYARLRANQLQLQGKVMQTDGSRVIAAEQLGTRDQAEQSGLRLAEQLLAQGAGDLLAGISHQATK